MVSYPRCYGVAVPQASGTGYLHRCGEALTAADLIGPFAEASRPYVSGSVALFRFMNLGTRDTSLLRESLYRTSVCFRLLVHGGRSES